MKIVVMDGNALNPGDLSWKGFEEMGEMTIYPRTPYQDGEAEIIRRAKGAEVLLINKTPLTREVLTALMPELKYVGVLATGYNVVDIAAAAELGITVTNVPAYGTPAVAQFTMALLLELCHRVGQHSQNAKAGRWPDSPDFCYWETPQTELWGKTMGIIGYGQIGKAVARLASAFGMKVLAVSHSGSGDEIAKKVQLDELLRESDVISLHCPLFPETKQIINRESIAQMKDGVLIINTARGPLIDGAALAEALESGKVAGAAVDVLDQEPPRRDDPLLCHPRCIVTPHIAWAPIESRQRLMEIAVRNLHSFLAGKAENQVNGN